MNAPDASNKENAALFLAADELGAKADTLAWVLCGVHSLTESRQGEHITAREICAGLIRDLNRAWNGRIEDGLDYVGIASGEDVGRLIFGLGARELLQVGPKDRPEDFAGIFTRDTLAVFLQSAGIARRRLDLPRLKRWVEKALYLSGFAIVVASYGGLVSTKVAWIGWCVGMAGFALHYVKPPEPKRF